MKLKRYELRDPQQLIDDVCSVHPLVDGELLIVLIEEPSRQQEVVAVRRVAAERWHGLGQTDLSDLLCEEARAMPLDPAARERPHHLLLTIRARRGLTVIDAADAEILVGWRYANHIMPVFDGGLLLVTEHGWYDLDSGCAGRSPALAA